MRKSFRAIKKSVVVCLLTVSMLLSGCEISFTDWFKPKPSDEAEDTVYTLQYTDDTGIHQILVEDGALYSLETLPQRTGYDFVGLFDAEVGGTQYVSAAGASLAPYSDKKNMVLYPRFKPKEYTFYLNYGESSTSGVPYVKADYGSILYGLPTYLQASEVSKEFCGWYTQSGGGGIQVATASGSIAGNALVQEPLIDVDEPTAELFAYFAVKVFTVSFYSQDGEMLLATMQLPYGANVNDAAKDVMQNNKAVLSWSTIRNGTPFTGIIDHDMSFYARELGIRVTFDADGGSSVAAIDLSEDEALTSLPDCTRSGYSFVGWYDANGNLCEDGYKPSGNTTLTARWRANQYTATLKAEGGSVGQTVYSVTFGTKYQLPVPTRTGYDFCGWYSGDTQMTDANGASLTKWYSTYNETLYARWQLKETETVYVSLNRVNCKQDNGFDPSAYDSQTDFHEGFELGDLVVSGCVHNNDGSYTTAEGQGPVLQYRLLNNPDALKTYGGVNLKNNLNSDTYNGSVYGTNISGKTIGKGAYYIKVVYTDGSYTESSAVNFMVSAKNGSRVPMDYSILRYKVIDRIEVTVLYELHYQYYDGWAVRVRHIYTNWRCTATLYFE